MTDPAEVDVYFTEPGLEDLRSLEPEVQGRVKAKLREARERPGHHLRGLEGYDLYALLGRRSSRDPGLGSIGGGSLRPRRRPPAQRLRP